MYLDCMTFSLMCLDCVTFSLMYLDSMTFHWTGYVLASLHVNQTAFKFISDNYVRVSITRQLSVLGNLAALTLQVTSCPSICLSLHHLFNFCFLVHCGHQRQADLGHVIVNTTFCILARASLPSSSAGWSHVHSLCLALLHEHTTSGLHQDLTCRHTHTRTQTHTHVFTHTVIVSSSIWEW